MTPLLLARARRTPVDLHVSRSHHLAGFLAIILLGSTGRGAFGCRSFAHTNHFRIGRREDHASPFLTPILAIEYGLPDRRRQNSPLFMSRSERIASIGSAVLPFQARSGRLDRFPSVQSRSSALCQSSGRQPAPGRRWKNWKWNEPRVHRRAPCHGRETGTFTFRIPAIGVQRSNRRLRNLRKRPFSKRRLGKIFGCSDPAIESGNGRQIHSALSRDQSRCPG